VPRQLSLRINLNDDATFENFYVCNAVTGLAPVAQQVIEVVKTSLSPDSRSSCSSSLYSSSLPGKNSLEPFVYLWGSTGSGVSHLLQASCHWCSSQGRSAQYLPLAALQGYPPAELLENLEQLSLICLDDVQVVAGNRQWEQVLFDFYNRVRQAGGCLLAGANCPARELPLDLPDLQSRFAWGPVFQLPALGDEDKKLILQFRAERRGMLLTDEVAHYLINRAARGMNELMRCLDTLEDISLQEGRKLSIPFVKQVFGFQ
jgi:DnaA family protein